MSPGCPPGLVAARAAVAGPTGRTGAAGPVAVAHGTALLTAFVLLGSQFRSARPGGRAGRPSTPSHAVLLLVAAGQLLWRHRHPRAVVFGTAATVAVYLGAGYPYGPVLLTVAVACFGAVVAGHRKAAWAALGTLWAAHVLVAHWLYRWLPPSGDAPASWAREAVVATWVVAIVALAELARARREQWARERAERAQAARRRADEERLRIARELHDVLAHSLSVINVQAGVGLALLDTDLEQARTALATIKGASKEALGEVRQVLETLRAPGAAPRAPAPGLDRLARTGGGGGRRGPHGPCRGHRHPDCRPAADLAAFRVVQEALTDVVRHSGSRHARVRLAREGRRCAAGLRIDDDGPATGADAGGGGNGLAGMWERAAALGGTIEAGPRPGVGFRVDAVLPLSAPRHEEEDR
ncbi:histidine kinase OS=Streptomyces glaucescens OX=1907 GN=SGLAU_03875 PE=4 SV=1 [Streptomyces glaucescens]